jgi:hypothetical protein
MKIDCQNNTKLKKSGYKKIKSVGFLIFAIGTVLFGMIPGSVKAVDVGRTDLGLDDSLMKTPVEYAQNTHVQVAPIFLPTERTIKDEEWMRGLYFYSVERLGYADIPFDYIIVSDGTVYQTNKTGDSIKVNILNGSEKSIIVGYLASKGDSDFSDEAKVPLRTLLLNISNNNGIKAENISVNSLRFNIKLNTKTSTLESKELTGEWNTSLKSMKSFISQNYSPIKKKYHIQIVEVKAPTDKVQPGDTVIVDMKLKNTGLNPIFADSDASLLASKKDGKPSKFFLNEVWASRSQVPILAEGDIIKPDEEKSFQIKFRVPLYFGTQKETFIIKDYLGNKIDGTDFEISMSVANISQTVVEILNTETGYLNVRSRDGGGDTTGRVSPGERYIQLKSGDYGYVQIDLGNGKSGWVSRKYVKKVN